MERQERKTFDDSIWSRIVPASIGFLTLLEFANIFIESRRDAHYSDVAMERTTSSEKRQAIYEVKSPDANVLIPLYSIFNNRYEHIDSMN